MQKRSFGEDGRAGRIEKMENGVCSIESNGSRDVFSCNSSDISSADHLVVMVHGVCGSPGDWKFGAKEFVKHFPDKVFVHCSEKNMDKLSLDGVDVMGERLAQEVCELIERKPGLRKISFLAHSLGGLVARYAIGRLYRPGPKDSITKPQDSTGTIHGLEAMNFITVATPHLGSRGNKQVPFLFGFTVAEKIASYVVHFIYGKTGKHLFLTDRDEGKPPLLRRMIEDCGNCYFMSALRTFRRRVAYSNVGCDHMVGWRTSSIRRNSELPKWRGHLDEKYLHVVYQEHCKARDGDQLWSISCGNKGSDKIEDELITGLSRVSWEKVDVSFHRSKQRFAAHSAIQVSVESRDIEGADVVQHIIDNFRC